MKIKISILALFLAFATTGLMAQTATPKVTKTQVNQQKRIIHGAKNGELTKQEARQLERQQRRINRTKKVAKADGTVTPKEKMVINRRQKRASKNIYRQKHDRQDRN
ncbi:MAG: hypothetical protein KDD63_26380 [Bacteroidetes bacterium]|nr:hypothetical protein [Bacteroidota bacterium]